MSGRERGRVWGEVRGAEGIKCEMYIHAKSPLKFYFQVPFFPCPTANVPCVNSGDLHIFHIQK